MAITSAICSSFKQELLQGKHNFSSSSGDSFKIALFTSSATLSKSTTAYTAPADATADPTNTYEVTTTSSIVAWDWADIYPLYAEALIIANAEIAETILPNTLSKDFLLKSNLSFFALILIVFIVVFKPL